MWELRERWNLERGPPEKVSMMGGPSLLHSREVSLEGTNEK